MKNDFFQFRQFRVQQHMCAMKVCTDACLFGAWVAEKMDPLQTGIQNILDIGAGTGLLSLMLAQKIPAAIDAVEVDGMAYGQAVENVANSAWKGRIRLVEADIKSYTGRYKYDLVVCNPPFYENSLSSPDASANKAKHSAALTLQQLIKAASDLLTPTGYFAVLLPYSRMDYFRELAGAAGYALRSLLLVRHSAQHPFFRSCLLFSRSAGGDYEREELAIKQGDKYTERFCGLLNDYYLDSSPIA